MKTLNIGILLCLGMIVLFSSFALPQVSGVLEVTFQPQNNITQFVLWIENAEGDYIETVYITDFIGRRGGGNRTADPDIDSGSGNRLTALPVWSHSRNVTDLTYGIESLYPPPSTKPAYPADIDAVSQATPGPNIQAVSQTVREYEAGEYQCWIEANKSFDFNESYNYSFYRGQPALVWNIPIEISDSEDSGQVLEYTGYGSPDGSDGDIRPPDETITTAAGLLSDMGGYKFKVTFTPDPVQVQNKSAFSLPERTFMLDQNVPNPFNPSTRISYRLSGPGYVELNILNSRGRQIRKVVSRSQTAGYHEIQLKADDLASGIYFYQLYVDGNMLGIHKMLLLR